MKKVASERRAEIDAIVKAVSGMTPEQRHAMVFSHGAVFNIGNTPLSPFNSCLVIRQNPGATIVGGFKQWLKAGRVVKKGEKGIGIWVPTVRKSKVEGEAPRTGFVIGYVFDIEQTEELNSEQSDPSTTLSEQVDSASVS